jgi:hypothetical protein
MTKKEKEAHAELVVRVDGVKGRLERLDDQSGKIMAKQELAIQELGGRLERMERVICGMMGQGVYRSDLEIMKKWQGNRWVVPVAKKGFGLDKKNGAKPRLKRKNAK